MYNANSKKNEDIIGKKVFWLYKRLTERIGTNKLGY